MEHYMLEDRLRLAIDRHAIGEVIALLDKGADINGKDKHGLTPLHWAVNCDDLQIAELLIARGCDIDARNEAMDMTPISLAAYNGATAMTVLLLMYGARTDIADAGGDTAYGIALSMEHKDVASLLEEQAPAADSTSPMVQASELQAALA